MSCPDTDRLIDLARGDPGDAELQAHLETCPACRADLLLIRELPLALSPEVEVPEHLIQRTMTNLRAVVARGEKKRDRRIEVLGAAVLGSLTAAAVILITGAGTASPATLGPFCLLAGVLSGATRAGPRQRKDLRRA